MERIEALRRKLHKAIEVGDKEVIQRISVKLDKEILKVTPRFNDNSFEKNEDSCLSDKR